ncbi:hypothetical protein DPMN_097443 [Dreissena polymorpha]|uniref:Uncharacterized protein n=1 Tax=Dreissena polymorpha TaxID=45954 RepID=A0A9D4LAA1_DREPO|nr:hypothetical protein DPMN_097443 [Dreissena polymorpha]
MVHTTGKIRVRPAAFYMWFLKHPVGGLDRNDTGVLRSKDVGHIVSTCFKRRSQCFNIIRSTVGVAGCLENTFTRSSCVFD